MRAILVCAALALTASCATSSPPPDGGEAKSEAPSSSTARPVPPAPKLVTTSPFGGARPAPDNVIMIAGFHSLKGLAASAALAAGKVMPGAVPDLESYGLEMMAANLGLTDTSWFDRAAPIQIVVPDLTTYSDGVMLVPTVDPWRALDAFPEASRVEAAGHDGAVLIDGRTVFLDVVERSVAVSRDSRVFGDLQRLLAQRVVAWQPRELMSLLIAPANVSRIYQQQIDSVLSFLPSLAELGGSSAEEVEIMTAAVRKLLTECGRARLSFDSRDGALIWELGFAGLSGTGLADLAGLVARTRLPYPSVLPPHSWLAATGAVDWRAVNTWRQWSRAQTLSLAKDAKMTDADTRRLLELDAEMLDLATGPTALGVFSDGVFPFAMVTLWETKDAAKVRANLGEQMALLVPPLWEELRAMVDEAFKDPEIPKKWRLKAPRMKKATAREFARAASGLLRPLGVEVRYERVKDGSAVVDVLRVKGRKVRDNLLPELKEVLTASGGSLEVAIAYEGTLAAAAFGPNGAKHARQLVAGKKHGGTPLIKTLTPEVAGALSLRLGPAVAALRKLEMTRPLVEDLPPIGDTAAVLSTLRTVTGDIGPELVVDLRVPLETLPVLALFFM